MQFLHFIKLFFVLLLATAPAQQVQAYQSRDLAPAIALAGALSCTAFSCLAYYFYTKVSSNQAAAIPALRDEDDTSENVPLENQEQILAAPSTSYVQQSPINLSPTIGNAINMLENNTSNCDVNLFLTVHTNKDFILYLEKNRDTLAKQYNDTVYSKNFSLEQQIAASLKWIIINETKIINHADDLFIYALNFVNYIEHLKNIDNIQQNIFLHIYRLECINKNYLNVLFAELNNPQSSVEKLVILINYLPKTKDWQESTYSLKKNILIRILWENKKLQANHNTKATLKNLIEKELPEEHKHLFDNLAEKQHTPIQKALQTLSPWYTYIIASTKATLQMVRIFYTHMHNACYITEKTPQSPRQTNITQANYTKKF